MSPQPRQTPSGTALWDIRQVHRSWALPHEELAFRGPDARILPDIYQANALRAVERCLIVHDDLLAVDELAEMQQAYADLQVGVSSRFQRDARNPFAAVGTGGAPQASDEQIQRLQTAKSMIVNRIWHDRFAFLLKKPEQVNHIDAWINDGPLIDGQKGRYHFTHYDCDEYLEFSKGLFRFAVYAAVFYLNVDPRVDGGHLWFPELGQAVVPATNRVAIFDARYAHSVLPASAPSSAKRVVLTMNVWDYATRNERIELETGTLGYVKNRRDELDWMP